MSSQQEVLPNSGREIASIFSLLLSIHLHIHPLSQNAQFKDSQHPLNTYFLLIYNEIYLFALGSSLKLKLLNTNRIAVFLPANIFTMTIYSATYLETDPQFYIYCYFLHFLFSLSDPIIVASILCWPLPVNMTNDW